MNWLNIDISTLKSPAYLGTNAAGRSTWLQTLAYCVSQENGGRIPGAALWKNRQWQEACGVTACEVRAASRLLVTEGEDIRVAFYPLEKEVEVQGRRVAAREAANRRWHGKLRGGAGARDIEEEPLCAGNPEVSAGAAMDAPANASRIAGGIASSYAEENGREENRKRMYAAHPDRTPCTLSADDASDGEGCVPVCFSPEAVEYGSRLEPPCPEQWCLKWWEDSERRGWLGPDGLRIVKWKAALSSYWRGVQEMERRVSAQQGLPHIHGNGIGGNNGNGNGSAPPGGSAMGGSRPGMEKMMSAFEIKTRLGSIEDELSRIRMRARDGRSDDGLRTIKLYTDEEKTRRDQLLQAKQTLQRKLTEAG